MLRFLIIAPGVQGAPTDYWREALGRAGVAHDVFVPSERAALTSAGLVLGTRGRYQAVIVTGPALRDLTADERATLTQYERRFSVRRISSYATPPSSSQRGRGSRMLRGMGSLTRAGARAFPDLRGQIPLDGEVLITTPTAPGRLTVLLQAGSTPLLIEVHHPDGRTELVDTTLEEPERLHSQLLAPGLIAWASSGVYLGRWRHHLSVQVDDVLLGNFQWDTRANRPGRTSRVITNPDDLDHAADWSRRMNLRLDLGINASGAQSPGGDCSQLGRSLLAHRSDFGFFNHTYRHLNLDRASEAVVADEVTRNVEWARRNRVPLDPTSVVTGEHSGLHNPGLAAALRSAGVQWIAAEAGDGGPAPRGPATTVPRLATNIYFDVATRAELLDEYNHRARRGREVGWEQMLRDEAGELLRHVLGNDPRPLFVHQSNLAAERTLYPFLDRILRIYRRSVRAPILQPTLAQSGRDQLRWRRFAEQRANLTAWRTGNRLSLRARHAMDVPVTGVTDGTVYAGRRSRWVRVAAGTTVTLPVVSAAARQGPRARRVRALRDACRWAPVFAGYPVSELQGYDMVVADAVPELDGQADTSVDDVARLQARGTLTLAYLSVGTVERWRHYARGIPSAWKLRTVRGWEGEHYVDVRRAGWRRILLREARRLARMGFDGLALDNIDVAEAFPVTRAGVVRALRDLRRAVPDLVIVAINGLGVVEPDRIDAMLHEEVFARADRGYRITPRAETARLLAALRPLRDQGRPVFTLDYTPPGAPLAARIVRRSRREGFRPAVSTRTLDRPPHAAPGPKTTCHS